MAGMNVRDDVLNQIPKPKPSGRDLAYRAVAAVFGGPVDLTAMVMKPFGYGVEKPVLGSEWIGQKMENVGLVSEARDPMQEFMASLLVPGGGIEAVPAMAGKGMAMLPAAMGVVKAKGGNWLTGSVEDALKPLKDVRGAYPTERIAELPETLRPAAMRSNALNTWIEGPLTKYVKTRMASPGDEIRKLADQGVLHADPVAWPGDADRVRDTARSKGYQAGVLSPAGSLGRSWEDVADANLDIGTNPNFPEESLYGLRPQGNLNNLGFRHLTDELSNALNPESGLPRALQLTPDQMKNLSVEKAVRRVADINKWRANQMAEANKAIAFDEKTAPTFKEYQTVPGYGNGQPNEKGLHWREIKPPEVKGPEDLSEDGAKHYQRGLASGASPEDAFNDVARSSQKQLLERQLAYEGDTMGHCVGGYCDAVLSGESQVYTLRDKAGKPHVTIEVKQDYPSDPADIAAVYQELYGQRLNPKSGKYQETLMNFMDTEDYYNYLQSLPPPPMRIEQIKGAKNSAPKDEYVPFIQDFIRSGKFSDVGDLQNARLVKASQTFNKTELKTLEKHGAKLAGEEYLTEKEVEALQSLFKKAKDQ